MEEIRNKDTLQYLFSLPITKVRNYFSVSNVFDKITLNGDWAEFGTGMGNYAEIICDNLPKDTRLHLFDWFKGLPEDWTDGRGNVINKKGDYKGEPSKRVTEHPNVIVHRGLFEETLPIFVESQENNLAFINIDCDLYSSTKTVLDNINEFIKPGTIIHFDEYYNYVGWELHEFKAFMEYVYKFNREFEYLVKTQMQQVILRILK
jgi:hypothetical protein